MDKEHLGEPVQELGSLHPAFLTGGVACILRTVPCPRFVEILALVDYIWWQAFATSRTCTVDCDLLSSRSTDVLVHPLGTFSCQNDLTLGVCDETTFVTVVNLLRHVLHPRHSKGRSNQCLMTSGSSAVALAELRCSVFQGAMSGWCARNQSSQSRPVCLFTKGVSIFEWLTKSCTLFFTSSDVKPQPQSAISLMQPTNSASWMGLRTVPFPT